MKFELEQKVNLACMELFNIEANVELSRPDEQFGEYSTSVAMQIANKFGTNPIEISNKLVPLLKTKLGDQVTDINVAGPGFINIKLSDQTLIRALEDQPQKKYQGKTIVAEYSDPNPFKVLHAGHLYTSLVGDAVSRLMEYGGAKVYRVNFGGDVGLHVGKTMWAIIKELQGEFPEKLNAIKEQKLDWLSERYVEGNNAYEEDEQVRNEINSMNKRVYVLHADNDHTSSFAQIYWTAREWSYKGFDDLYKRLKMLPFDKYYPESEVADLGLLKVKENVGKVYEESDGAIIFRGEKYGLFTQVFINGEGLPTYAAKDVGLIFHKQQDFSPNLSFIITDVAQKDHLAVVLKSISLFEPELVEATTHFIHGQIKMAGGIKMSSRKGNILKAADILEAAADASKKINSHDQQDIILSAVKYSFLKNRVGGNIVYDPSESVSLEGNSGPYLQYAHARARSILRKANTGGNLGSETLEGSEHSLLRKITEYREIVDKAVSELMPHSICTYLYELAQVFNRFYEQNRVIDDQRQDIRLALVEYYANTLKEGLDLLGIPAPDKM